LSAPEFKRYRWIEWAGVTMDGNSHRLVAVAVSSPDILCIAAGG